MCISVILLQVLFFFSDGIKVSVGDFITLKSETPNEPLWVAKVVHMYDNLPQKFMFHGLLFCRGSDTILSGTADPRELFLVDNCDDLPLGSIIRKAKVRPVTVQFIIEYMRTLIIRSLKLKKNVGFQCVIAILAITI